MIVSVSPFLSTPSRFQLSVRQAVNLLALEPIGLVYLQVEPGVLWWQPGVLKWPRATLGILKERCLLSVGIPREPLPPPTCQTW